MKNDFISHVVVKTMRISSFDDSNALNQPDLNISFAIVANAIVVQRLKAFTGPLGHYKDLG